MGRTARACSDTWCLYSHGPFEVRVMQQIFKQVPEAFPCGAGAGPPLILIYSYIFSNKYAAPEKLLPAISSKKEWCWKDSTKMIKEHNTLNEDHT